MTINNGGNSFVGTGDNVNALYNGWKGSGADTILPKAFELYFVGFTSVPSTGGNGRDVRYYINGVKTNGSDINESAPGGPISRRFSIGDQLDASDNPKNRRFQGLIESVFVWNRVLTDSEIYWLYKEPYAFIVPK